MAYGHDVIDMVATGQGLRAKMDKQDISIKELAATLGVSFQAVWRYINGETLPTVPHLFEIAQILDSPVDELIVMKKPKNKRK